MGLRTPVLSRAPPRTQVLRTPSPPRSAQDPGPEPGRLRTQVLRTPSNPSSKVPEQGLPGPLRTRVLNKAPLRPKSGEPSFTGSRPRKGGAQEPGPEQGSAQDPGPENAKVSRSAQDPGPEPRGLRTQSKASQALSGRGS